MSGELCRVESEDGTVLVTRNRPGRIDALHRDAGQELARAPDMVEGTQAFAERPAPVWSTE